MALLIALAAISGVVPPQAAGHGRLAPPHVYNGRQGELTAEVPRVEGQALTLDGVLDEPVWQDAAILTGFSQYFPADGVAAEDSTEIRIWYSPTALHVGVRAHARPGTVRSTLADRDKITQDDNIQLFLGTFNDGRQALVFSVNPLGVQSDGVLVETGAAVSSANGAFGANTPKTRETVDLSPDFVWQSKGRVTDAGYEVEISIPFKSIRYQTARQQVWQLNVVRTVQLSAQEQVWAPARRANPSFLQQSGRLTGLHDLQRGLVLDLTPTVTERATGAPDGAGGWRYSVPGPQFGGAVRWGITNNLTLAGTANPDFSQVEADATTFSIDPRSSVFFPERRPFFLEGSEQFTVPNNLVYTRRIVQPVGAVKLTGKVGSTDVGVITALDGQDYSATGTRNPFYGIVRVQRDLGGKSRIGMLLTDKEDGPLSNRVLDVDGRLVFGKVSVQAQFAASRTDSTGTGTTAPLFDVGANIADRAFNGRYRFYGRSRAFDPRTGFISRPGISEMQATQNYTFFGSKQSIVDAWTPEVYGSIIWNYSDLWAGQKGLEYKFHLRQTLRFKGGWTVGAQALFEKFNYDSTLYANYYVVRPRTGAPGADTVRYTGQPFINNVDWVVSVATPELDKFSFNAAFLWGHDENFPEWSQANIIYTQGTLNFRPNDQLRIQGTYTYELYNRQSDGTTALTRFVPRLRVEYQLTRQVFVRFIGEYSMARQDSLRDDSRTNLPIVILNPSTGTFARAAAFQNRRLRGDFLFSYLPTPGTIVYLGYTNIQQTNDPLGVQAFARTADVFFAKLSYLFRW